MKPEDFDWLLANKPSKPERKISAKKIKPTG